MPEDRYGFLAINSFHKRRSSEIVIGKKPKRIYLDKGFASITQEISRFIKSLQLKYTNSMAFLARKDKIQTARKYN